MSTAPESVEMPEICVCPMPGRSAEQQEPEQQPQEGPGENEAVGAKALFHSFHSFHRGVATGTTRARVTPAGGLWAAEIQHLGSVGTFATMAAAMAATYAAMAAAQQ